MRNVYDLSVRQAGKGRKGNCDFAVTEQKREAQINERQEVSIELQRLTGVDDTALPSVG